MNLESDQDDSRREDAPDLRRLAQGWITLWESEIAALAADPEMREAWQAMASVWAGAMTAALRAVPAAPAPAAHDPGPCGDAGAMMRRGPRPLLLHLTLAMLRS